MRLQYQRVNPEIGGESSILRFEGVESEESVCVLLNSGRGVDISELGGESANARLDCVLVTQPHPEYYATLGENGDNETPIYAASDTATIISAALTEPHARTPGQKEAVLDRLVPVDERVEIAPGVSLYPVAAGHAPGAAGFLFEIETEAGERHTVYLTDECTLRPAGGYPGIADLPFGIDTLLVSGVTPDRFTETITESLSVICEHVQENVPVLVTADEPTGLHAAYLLGHLSSEVGQTFPITATGRIGALCDRLGYSIPHVTTQPGFEEPGNVLTHGSVTIADPNSPVQGISGELFEALADNPMAAVVRLTRGVATPASPAQCTVQSFPWHNTLSPESLETIIESLHPTQVVVGGRSNRVDIEEEIECESFVWDVSDDLVYTLHDGQRWVSPTEIDGATEDRIRQRARDRARNMKLSEYDLARPERANTVDLTAEGIDIEAIRNRLAPQAGRYRQPPNPTNNGTHSIDASLADLHDQIDQIKSTIGGRTFWGSVVDAGDVCLLKIQDPPALEHGQDVMLVLDEVCETEANGAAIEINGSPAPEHTSDESDSESSGSVRRAAAFNKND